MEHELYVDSIGFEGKAIARDDSGFVYFVHGAVPGDHVIAEVRARRKRYAEARIRTLLHPSPLREYPHCSHFGVCGGCVWQHLRYEEQCAWKTQHVRDAFERIGKVSFGVLHNTLPSETRFYYRNKMEFSFAPSRWILPEEITRGETITPKLALGLHIPGRFDKVLDLDACFLQSAISNRILHTIRTAACEHALTAFQTRTHQGFLRNLVIRNSTATNEYMVILVTSPVRSHAEETFIRWFERDFIAQVPEISTAIHAVSTSKSTVAVGEPRIVYGQGFITETLLGIRYRISPFSFFQTNTRQAEHLLRIALEYAGDIDGKTVWDLYCGTGSITLAAARRAQVAVGIELVESAVHDAWYNAHSNGISNVAFHTADIHSTAGAQILSHLPPPDVVILDPPRAGLHSRVIACLLEIAPARIVYVSCNPTTQARDCALLATQYRIDAIQPVDMFPHTYHIESVAQLTRIAPEISLP
ncbi:MAG: 23S rRNA (uracil(1939)-C(5))-methyltransferase RlmD [Bacteroidota bacterium]|nr:23S rRNA (uracil(1939)-C(5))-methyltransferase RlmD [Candidatus Kapabacteria bacterium]MDW8219254.1 23S rRNA (uracil(1939)-C(5))-methyltransferase RlmD [Bacteroidota bacterium]